MPLKDKFKNCWRRMLRARGDSEAARQDFNHASIVITATLAVSMLAAVSFLTTPEWRNALAREYHSFIHLLMPKPR